MTGPVVIDSTPLVAFLEEAEPKHDEVCRILAAIPSPLLTVEPVLTETAHLVRRRPHGIAAVVGLVREGLLSVPMRLQDEASAIEKLVRTYESVPMSLADAALVRLMELTPKARLFTFDSDFKIYRLHGRRSVPLLD